MISLHTSIIIPCYNEEQVIAETYRRVKAVMKEFKKYEIIFIDDGSRDQTRTILRNLARADKTVRVLMFSGISGTSPLSRPASATPPGMSPSSLMPTCRTRRNSSPR